MIIDGEYLFRFWDFARIHHYVATIVCIVVLRRLSRPLIRAVLWKELGMYRWCGSVLGIIPSATVLQYCYYNVHCMALGSSMILGS